MASATPARWALSRAMRDGASVLIEGDSSDEPMGAAALARFGEQLLAQRGDVAAPAVKAEALAEEARRSVGGDERGFDRQRAGAAHRVDERQVLAARDAAIPRARESPRRGSP